MTKNRRPRRTAKILDFIPMWSAETPMEALKHAENEIRQGRFDNIFIVLHKTEEEGDSSFFTLKNDMPFDAQAACSMWLLGYVLGTHGEDDE